jgi:hypothetical protein
MPLCSNVLALDRSREVGLKGRSARLSAVDACSGDDVAVELEKLKVTSIKIVCPSATVISLITGTCNVTTTVGLDHFVSQTMQ